MLENGLNALWQSMGIPNLVWGQVLMILIGGLLIFLAIRKGFEPLLLLPIGFGCILANVPVAGLAEDGVGRLLLEAKPEHLAALAQTLGVPVTEVVYAAKNATGEALTAAKLLAHNLDYQPGMLYQFYSVAIGSGVAPLLIFMGVGALTDFGALIAMADASASEKSNPGTAFNARAPISVVKMPNCAAAPSNKVEGFAINAPKSVNAPTPMKINSGATPEPMATE